MQAPVSDFELSPPLVAVAALSAPCGGGAREGPLVFQRQAVFLMVILVLSSIMFVMKGSLRNRCGQWLWFHMLKKLCLVMILPLYLLRHRLCHRLPFCRRLRLLHPLCFVQQLLSLSLLTCKWLLRTRWRLQQALLLIQHCHYLGAAISLLHQDSRELVEMDVRDPLSNGARLPVGLRFFSFQARGCFWFLPTSCSPQRWQ